MAIVRPACAAARKPRNAKRQNTPDHGMSRHADGRWLPGASPNPGGRPAKIAEVRELAREHTEQAVATLVEIAEKGRSEQARIAASVALLDRGWGRPTQPIAGDDDMPPIGMTVEDRRRETEERRRKAAELVDQAFGETAEGSQGGPQ